MTKVKFMLKVINVVIIIKYYTFCIPDKNFKDLKSLAKNCFPLADEK